MSGARRWVLAGALAAGVALAPGVSATPGTTTPGATTPGPTTPGPTTPGPTTPATVGQHHHDTASAVVRGTDGLTYQVTFALDATQGNPSSAAALSVKYKACKRTGSCGFTYTYGLTLSPAQLSLPDANSATVTATLLGKPLRLQWTAHPGMPGSSFSLRSAGDDLIAVYDPTSGGSADFAATFFGLSCGGNGEVLNEYGVFGAPVADSTTGKSRLPAGFVTKRGHKPGCQSG